MALFHDSTFVLLLSREVEEQVTHSWHWRNLILFTLGVVLVGRRPIAGTNAHPG